MMSPVTSSLLAGLPDGGDDKEDEDDGRQPGHGVCSESVEVSQH